VYNGKVALPIGKMILFLKGYQAKDVETKVVDVPQPAVEPQKSEVEEAPKPEVVVDPQPTAVTESK
jgi:hypothetical protein